MAPDESLGQNRLFCFLPDFTLYIMEHCFKRLTINNFLKQIEVAHENHINKIDKLKANSNDLEKKSNA